MPHDTQTVAAALARVQERWDRGAYWTAQDAADALEIGVAVWQAAVGAWTARIVPLASPGDPLIPAPGLEQVTAVRYLGRPLVRTTLEALSYMRPSWRVDMAGDPGIPSAPEYWAPVGLTTVAVWPAPSAMGGFTLDGLSAPPVITLLLADSLPIDLPEVASEAVVSLGAWWGAGKVGPDEQDKHQPGLDAALLAATEALEDTAALAPLQAWMTQLSAHQLPLRTPEAEA